MSSMCILFPLYLSLGLVFLFCFSLFVVFPLLAAFVLLLLIFILTTFLSEIHYTSLQSMETSLENVAELGPK